MYLLVLLLKVPIEISSNFTNEISRASDSPSAPNPLLQSDCSSFIISGSMIRIQEALFISVIFLQKFFVNWEFLFWTNSSDFWPQKMTLEVRNWHFCQLISKFWQGIWKGLQERGYRIMKKIYLLLKVPIEIPSNFY